jgi:hypothetical protein
MRVTWLRATGEFGLSLSNASQSPSQKSNWRYTGAAQADAEVVLAGVLASALNTEINIATLTAIQQRNRIRIGDASCVWFRSRQAEELP